MSVGILRLTFHLPDCHSLKETRGRVQTLLARLPKEFNISVVEAADHDLWQSCQLLITCAARDGQQAEVLLGKVIQFCEDHWPDLPLTNEHIEIMNG